MCGVGCGACGVWCKRSPRFRVAKKPLSRQKFFRQIEVPTRAVPSRRGGGGGGAGVEGHASAPIPGGVPQIRAKKSDEIVLGYAPSCVPRRVHVTRSRKRCEIDAHRRGATFPRRFVVARGGAGERGLASAPRARAILAVSRADSLVQSTNMGAPRVTGRGDILSKVLLTSYNSPNEKYCQSVFCREV